MKIDMVEPYEERYLELTLEELAALERGEVSGAVRERAARLAQETTQEEVYGFVGFIEGAYMSRRPCAKEGCPGLELRDGRPDGCGHPTITEGCPYGR